MRLRIIFPSALTAERMQAFIHTRVIMQSPTHLREPWPDLLEEDGVVALEGLENVVVGAPDAEAVDGRVAVPAAALAARRQRGRREAGHVRL